MTEDFPTLPPLGGDPPPFNKDLHDEQRRQRRRPRRDWSQEEPSDPQPEQRRFIVTQGWVMFSNDSVLLPWQMLPLSQGWSFQAAKPMRVRYKRLQVVVDSEGRPVDEYGETNAGTDTWADPLTMVITTYADSIAGFSGHCSRIEHLTMFELERYRKALSMGDTVPEGVVDDRLDPETKKVNLWKPSVRSSRNARSLRPIFYLRQDPKVVPEDLSECPGILQRYNILMGWRFVIPEPVCHLLVSGEPGVNQALLTEFERQLGKGTVNDELYIGGAPVLPEESTWNEKQMEIYPQFMQETSQLVFSEDDFLEPESGMRKACYWNAAAVHMPYPKSKRGGQKKGRKGGIPEPNVPEGVRRIHEFINHRPNEGSLERVLPGRNIGTRAVFGY